MARRRDHVAVNISRGARRARLGVWMRWSAGTWKILAGHLRANSLTIFLDLTASRAFFDDYSACRSFVWGPHPPLRNFIFSSSLDTRSAARYRFRWWGSGRLPPPDEPRFPRVRVQSHTRAEATREATGEAHFVALRAGRAFATGSSSGVGGRRRERVDASEPLGRVPFRDLPSPAARLPSARDGRGVHVAEGVLCGVAGDRLPRRRPESRAHSRRGCVPTRHPSLTPPRRLASPRLVSPRRSPRALTSPPSPLPSPPFPPRSRRKQNRGGAR